jgi:hypothetical protein
VSLLSRFQPRPCLTKVIAGERSHFFTERYLASCDLVEIQRSLLRGLLAAFLATDASREAGPPEAPGDVGELTERDQTARRAHCLKNT